MSDNKPMISDEAVEAAARQLAEHAGFGFDAEFYRADATAALEAAMPHILHRTSHVDELTDLIWENTDGEDEEAASAAAHKIYEAGFRKVRAHG